MGDSRRSARARCEGLRFTLPLYPRGAEIVRSLYMYFGRMACLLSEKELQFSDMNSNSPDLKTAILDRIRADAPRKVWTPSDFVDLASRDAVDKALQRLTKAETLRRIDRGLYDQPGFNKLTQKPNPPDPRSVIDAVGRRDQTRMLVDGMTAANDLGLTDAVPAKIVVHTDARRRAIKLGNVTITFRPTAASKLFWAGRPAMRVVQALHWLRDLLVREGESDQIKRKLAKLFEDPTSGAGPQSRSHCRYVGASDMDAGVSQAAHRSRRRRCVAGTSTMIVAMLMLMMISQS